MKIDIKGYRVFAPAGSIKLIFSDFPKKRIMQALKEVEPSFEAEPKLWCLQDIAANLEGIDITPPAAVVK